MRPRPVGPLDALLQTALVVLYVGVLWLLIHLVAR